MEDARVISQDKIPKVEDSEEEETTPLPQLPGELSPEEEVPDKDD